MKEFEKNSKIDELVFSSIDNIKTLIDSNAVVGEPVFSTEGTVIIPISTMSVGFLVGGGEYGDNSARRLANHYPMAGGSGGGISIKPKGFIVDNGREVKYIDVENKDTYQTVLNLFNKLINLIGEKNEKN